MERLRDSSLTSLLITDAAQGRVIAADPDLLEVGIVVGDSFYRARQKAPFAAVIEADVSVYYARHEAAFSALSEFADRIETVGLGEFLMRWSSAKDFSASGYDFQVETLAQRMREVTGLLAQIGVASHRFTAQQAARRPSDNGIVVIYPGKDARSLAALPITVLPEVSNDMLLRLRDFGIHSLGQLSALPDAAFARQFGGKHRWLRDLARGRDPRPLNPDAPPLRLMRLHQFETPTPRRSDIFHVARALVQAISRRLDTGGYRAEALRLSLTFANGQTSETVHALKPPSADAERLTWYVAKLVEELPLRSPVARLTLVACPLRPWHEGSTQQLDLFDAEQTVKQQRLEVAIGQVKRRYGERCVSSAAQMLPPEPVPAQVEARTDGTPLRVYNGAQWLDVVYIEEDWCKEWGWWDKAQRRDYYRVLLADGTLRNLFLDISGTWYVDKAWLVL